KFFMSVGTAIAASKIAKAVSNIELQDVLGTVGLSRRRSHFLENLGLVAAGAIVGAGAAMLFAPSSGRETRRRLSEGASKLGQAALDAAREQKDEALRSLSQVANGAIASDHRA
ncbi:MAG TPA: YtxH domain-containing protein, partial [Polyangiaceae bacterium]|nr:YtxH domain-containing protein [Polyangiaceae bacterium]